MPLRLFLSWLRPAALLSTFLCSAAHAQGTPANPPPAVSERDQQARKLFEQGRQAYTDGRYRDAWAYFHDAYQLSGRPELLFNIGQTADRLGQTSDAIKAFSMYVERLPDAPNRKDVESRVRALQAKLDAQQQAAPPSRAPVASNPQPHAAPAKPALPTPPVIEPKRKEPRRGFFLHAALGVGYRGDAISSSDDASGDAVDYQMNGFGLALDLGVGWGVLPGFAIGGGILLDWASSPTVSREDGAEAQLSSAQLTTIGPFVDWYPVRKTLGWFIQGGFGLAVLSYKSDAGSSSGDAYGFSLHLGTGYEWNLSPSLGLGVELRFLTSVLGEAVSGETTSHVLTAPSLLASLTWF